MRRFRCFRLAIATLLPGASLPGAPVAQGRAAVEQERRDFAEWLRSAPLSPRRAVGVFPLGGELSLGPASAAIPLAGVEAAGLMERGGRITLRVGKEIRPLARGRAATLGNWHLLVSGASGRSVVTVFAAQPSKGKEPAWFPYDPKAVFPVTLIPPTAPGGLRVLAPDAVEVEATQAGTVSFPLGGRTQTLHVLRMPGASEEESELEIFFRDGSNDHTTYPAGRFVSLLPQPGGGYLLDLNRARNPFCAYNTAYPCPAQWRGNALTGSVSAGERYQGASLQRPPQG